MPAARILQDGVEADDAIIASQTAELLVLPADREGGDAAAQAAARAAWCRGYAALAAAFFGSERAMRAR